MQSKTMSAVESIANVVVGLSISWVVTFTMLPAWGFEPSASAAVEISALFTGISLMRSYVLRRFFNYVRVKHGF